MDLTFNISFGSLHLFDQAACTSVILYKTNADLNAMLQQFGWPTALAVAQFRWKLPSKTSWRVRAASLSHCTLAAPHSTDLLRCAKESSNLSSQDSFIAKSSKWNATAPGRQAATSSKRCPGISKIGSDHVAEVRYCFHFIQMPPCCLNTFRQ